MLVSAATPVVTWVLALVAVVAVVVAVLARAAASRQVAAGAATVDDLLGVRRRLAGADPAALDRAIVREALGLVDAAGAALVHREAGALVVGHASGPEVLRAEGLDGSIVDRVAASGRRRSQVVADDPALGAPAAVLAVPMAGPGRVDAVLVVVRPAAQPFAAADGATLSAMVAVAGDVVASARLASPADDRDGSGDAAGLGSRARFDRELGEAIVDGETRAAITALAVVEVDGDDVDDGAVATVAAVVRSSVRPSDRTYRFDRRSIAVVMPGADLATACQVAERVRAALAELAVGDAGAGPVTASFGVSSCTGGEPARLVARADDARREAAEAGDRVVARW